MIRKTRLKIRIITSLLIPSLLLIGLFSSGIFLISYADIISPLSEADLGNWTDYNGVVFNEGVIHNSVSGGALAIGGVIEVNDNDYSIGSTYSAVYDATQHIGEYKNAGGYPAFLFGGSDIKLSSRVNSIDVLGGDIAMTSDMLQKNASFNNRGFIPLINSNYRTLDSTVVKNWFERQYEITKKTSALFTAANDVEIDISAFAGGSYKNAGPEHYKNKHLTLNGEVYENALFITVRTETDIDFGQWWPVYSVIHFDVNWAMNYDLVVFNFPDAINVTMNSSTFFIDGTSHWSTTVDAWIGEQGMQERLALAEKVIYNFPSARSIEATRTLIQGTILAPDASFIGIGTNSDGHIYGHLVVKDFVVEDNFTIHAFNLSNWAYDIAQDAVEPDPPLGSILLRQYLFFDSTTQVPISGGEYILINADTHAYFDGTGFTDQLVNAMRFSPSSTGAVTINDLPLGNYILQNISAPDGFIVNDTDHANTHTYYQSAVEVSLQDEIITVRRYIQPKRTDVSFLKVNADTKAGLSGAVFTLIREQDSYSNRMTLGEYTSDQLGAIQIDALAPGKYHLVETFIPQGYELVDNGEFFFEIYWDNADSRLKIRDADGEVLAGTVLEPIEINNRPGIPENTLVIIKYSLNEDNPLDTSRTLGGAEFDIFLQNEDGGWEKLLFNSLGDQINITTNEEGYYRIQNLDQGTYRLVERKPPRGHSLYNEFTGPDFEGGWAYQFTFDQLSSSYIAYLPNRPLFSDITLKLNGLLFNTPLPLQNGLFSLETLLENGTTWQYIDMQVITNSDGEAVIGKLSAGQYRLIQLQSATGYNVLDPPEITFTLDYDADNNPIFTVFHNNTQVTTDTPNVYTNDELPLHIIIENTPRLRGFTIYKIDDNYFTEFDESGKPIQIITYLENAIFRLQRMRDDRLGWQDYGDAFTSRLLYDGQQPMEDQYGNHIAGAIFEEGLIYGDYRLIEIKAPDGYKTGSSVEVTLNSGEKGYQINQFSITHSMTGTGSTTTHVVTNYIIMKTTELNLKKVDIDDISLRLKNAEFTLYTCSKMHIHDDIVKHNSCWSQNTPLTAKSDANGLVTFEALSSGEYLLMETTAPVGYRLPMGHWRIIVNALTEDFTFYTNTPSLVPAIMHDPDNEQVSYLIPNLKSQDMPLTGGSKNNRYMIIGISMIAAAVLIISTKKIYKKTEESS